MGTIKVMNYRKQKKLVFLNENKVIFVDWELR